MAGSALVYFGIRSVFPNLDTDLKGVVYLIVAANTILFLIWRTWIYPAFFDPLRHIPVPKGGYPGIGFGFEQFVRPPSAKVLGWLNNIPNDGLLRYPSFFGRMRLIPTTPKTLSELLVTKSYDFVKPEPAKNLLRFVLGDGLVVVEGDVHKFQRKNINPTFSFRHIKDLYPVMWAKSVEMVKCISSDESELSNENKSEWRVLEANSWASRATLDIIGVAALGKEFNALKNTDDELVRVYEWLFKPTKALQFWFAANLILPRYIAKCITWNIDHEVASRGNKLRQLSREFVRSKREAMKGETTQSVDTLAHLIRTNNFSDDELVAQVLTFLAAGFVLSYSTGCRGLTI